MRPPPVLLQPVSPNRRDWVSVLHELARQLDDGRVYDRNLTELATALNAVLDAYGRRQPFVGTRRPGCHPLGSAG